MSDTFRGDILIVDDEPANLSLLSNLLVGHGYKVRAVLNGTRGLAAANASPPDLILMDVMMPGTNGYETCAQLKGDEKTRDIPIIFLSALNETTDKIKAFSCGGVDYVTKPFQVEEVVARVETQMAIRDLQRQLQSANAELRERLQEVQARNEELDAFAHMVAHDLKNPLSVILAYAELMNEPGAATEDPSSRQWSAQIAELAHRMNDIIEALLLLAEVRITQVELRPLDVLQIDEEAIDQARPMLQREQAEIVIVHPESWPRAMGYAPWIAQVWSNYVGNAIKYGGQPPRIEVGGHLEAGHTARFWVQDNGQGIRPEDQSRLFVEFSRLGERNPGSHGLGLSIVRRIIGKLGGEVGVDSRSGNGSRFFFTLPAADAVESQ